MKSPKMNILAICIFATLAMFEGINFYHFSFMEVPALLSICILFITFIYLKDTWFYYCWGLFTGVVIFWSLIVELLNQNTNTIAYIFDGGLVLLIFGYFGYKSYRKLSQSGINK